MMILIGWTIKEDQRESDISGENQEQGGGIDEKNPVLLEELHSRKNITYMCVFFYKE